MRKMINILVVLFLMCGMAEVSFAQTTNTVNATKSAVNTEIIKGTITSIDAAKSEIVVKANKTCVENTITVDSKAVSSLKIGEEVKVTLNKGSNLAVSLKKIVKKTTPTKK